MTDSFHQNGVKRRVDHGGDGFAEAHRTLPPWFLFQDVDGLVCITVSAQNTGERLFFEYVPDNYQHRVSRVRRFAYVAFFDRKRTIAAARHDGNTLSTANYLHMCRKLGAGQPVPTRFFWVCGLQQPPWTLYELDIESGAEIGVPREIPTVADYTAVWKAFGLFDTQATLQSWMHWTETTRRGEEPI